MTRPAPLILFRKRGSVAPLPTGEVTRLAARTRSYLVKLPGGTSADRPTLPGGRGTLLVGERGAAGGATWRGGVPKPPKKSRSAGQPFLAGPETFFCAGFGGAAGAPGAAAPLRARAAD